MKVSQADSAVKRSVLHSILLETFQYFGTIILILCSSLNLASFEMTALILAECAHIVFRGFELPLQAGTFKEKIKKFIGSIVPGVITIIIIAIVGIYVEEPLIKNILEYITKIAVVVLIFPITIPTLSDDREKDNFIKQYHILSNLQKFLKKFLCVLYRLLIISGLVLIIFAKSHFDFYFESLVITGCVLWFCRTILRFYCWWNCDLKEFNDSNSEISYASSSNINNGDRVLNDNDVYLLVKKIADRWSYKDDSVLFQYEGGGTVRYNVTVQVIGFSVIEYTINGKLSGVREEKLSSALSTAESKMDKAAFKITEETKNELAKHNLPYSSYDIRVIKGYIE